VAKGKSLLDYVNGIDMINDASKGTMKWHRQGVRFWIDLEVDQMKLLLARDASQLMTQDRILSDELLDVPGVDYVEYDGHFGAGISLYLVDGEFENDGRLKVEALIAAYLGPKWGELPSADGAELVD
jgi:hypothetical protein